MPPVKPNKIPTQVPISQLGQQQEQLKQQRTQQPAQSLQPAEPPANKVVQPTQPVAQKQPQTPRPVQTVQPQSSPSVAAKPVVVKSQSSPNATPQKLSYTPQQITTAMGGSAAGPGVPSAVLVFLQLVCIIVILFAFWPSLLWSNANLIIIGVFLVAIGLFVAVWTFAVFKQPISVFPAPKSTSFIVTNGPYRFMRHPMYFALFVSMLGVTIAYPTWPKIVALVILGLVLYLKIQREEIMLTNRFKGYANYKAKSGKYFPKFTGPKKVKVNLPPPPAKPL